MMGFMNVDNTNYLPLNGFTTVELGCDRGNNAYMCLQKNEFPFSEHFINLFDMIWSDKSKLQDVTEEVINYEDI